MGMGSQKVENKTYQLKPLERKHLKEMVILDSLCFPEEDAYSFEVMDYYFSSPFSFAIGYFKDEKLIAFVLWGKNHIITIDVHPEHRRKGLGKNLLSFSILRIKKKGYKKVYLEVDADNTPALLLYEKLNFKIERKFIENNKLRYLMSLKLKENTGIFE